MNFSVEAVVNGEFKDVSLSDYKGKYVVLFFYPLDFTFVCPTEILAFNDRADEFRKIGCEIVGASVDSKFSHLAWINTPRKEGGISGVTIPLLADLGVVRHITINDLPIGRSVDEALRVVQAVQFAEENGEVCPANWTPGKDTMKADPKGSKEYFRKAG